MIKPLYFIVLCVTNSVPRFPIKFNLVQNFTNFRTVDEHWLRRNHPQYWVRMIVTVLAPVHDIIVYIAIEQTGQCERIDAGRLLRFSDFFQLGRYALQRPISFTGQLKTHGRRRRSVRLI